MPTEQIQTCYGYKYHHFSKKCQAILLFCFVSVCQVNYNRYKNQSTHFHFLKCQNVGNKNNQKSEQAENNEVRGRVIKINAAQA